MNLRALAPLATLLTVTYAPRVVAQSDPAGAEALFSEGRAAMRQGAYGVACARFEESERLEPAVGTLINIAECEEHLGRLASAWEHWRRAIDDLSPQDDRVAHALDHAHALEPRVPRLTIRLAASAPLDAHVRRGDVELRGAAIGLAMPVDPGRYEVSVSAEGHSPRRYEVEMVEGQATELVVDAGPLVSAGTSPSPLLAAAPPKRDLPVAGIAVGSFGVAALGLGAVTGLLAIASNDTMNHHCSPAPDRACDPQGMDAASKGPVYATISTVSFVVGAAAVVAAVYLIVSHGQRLRPATLGAAW